MPMANCGKKQGTRGKLALWLRLLWRLMRAFQGRSRKVSWIGDLGSMALVVDLEC